MTASALPGLVVDIEARVDKLEKGLAKANALQRRGSDEMERRARQSADRLRATYGKAGEGIAASLSKLAVPFAGGLLGGAASVALTETLGKVNEVARGIAEIGNEAKRAGVSAKVFQEWKFVAEQNRIGVDQMIDGLKELNLRADEFVITGKGPAAEAFARLGYTAGELKTKLKDPSALLLEIIGRLQQMDRAAQIRIADEIFGGSAGERFVELIDQGEAGLRETIDRANELGIVMNDDLIAKADEINRRFNEIANTVGVALKSAIVSAADSLANFLDGFRSFQNQRSTSLQNRTNEIIREKTKTNERLNEVNSGSLTGRNKDRAVAVLNQKMRELDDEENEIIAILQERTVSNWTPNKSTWTPPTTGTGTATSKGSKGGGSSRKSDDFARAVEAIREETASLQAEALAMVAVAAAGEDYGTALEVARKESELLNAAQREGKTITPELRAEIAALARGYGEAAKATENAKNTQDRLKAVQQDIKGTFEGAFTGLISGAHSFNDALGMVLNSLAEMAASKFFDQIWGGGIGDGITGFLGKILGFVDGGWTGPGGRYQPAGIVHRDEFVFSKPAVQRLGVNTLYGLHERALRGYADGGYVTPLPGFSGPVAASQRGAQMGQNITINAPVTVNATGGDPAQNADLAGRMGREVEAAMRGVVVEELRRQMRPGGMVANRMR